MKQKDIKEFLRYYIGREVFAGTHRCRLIGLEDGAICIHRVQGRHVILFSNIKLILRKLESMKEDEAVEIFNLLNQNSSLQDEGKAREVKRQIGSRLFYNGATNLSGGDWAKVFHYLLSRGFDLFGLIEAGLAIEDNEKK